MNCAVQKKLAADQIERIRLWIEQGANWDEHWAFVPPKRPTIPQVERKSWPRGAVDHFVLARLEREGLEPSSEADRRTLIRRLILDLTGLPPTPKEVEDFLDDQDSLARLNQAKRIAHGDPEIEARIAQYEMAFRMQASVPVLVDLSAETEDTFELYGPDSRKPGTYAANCLLARRLAERGVRFIQLYHRGWDQHGGLPEGLRGQCQDTDQATAALVKDLKQRGMLDETLIVWSV